LGKELKSNGMKKKEYGAILRQLQLRGTKSLGGEWVPTIPGMPPAKIPPISAETKKLNRFVQEGFNAPGRTTPERRIKTTKVLGDDSLQIIRGRGKNSGVGKTVKLLGGMSRKSPRRARPRCPDMRRGQAITGDSPQTRKDTPAKGKKKSTVNKCRDVRPAKPTG